ncbi:MAG: phage terminase large subunit [Mariniphaga sp.]
MMILTKKQSEALDYLEDKTTNELLFGGGAGGSKSFLGCYWILKSALKYAGTRWLIGRNELKTLRETTLNTFFEVASMQGIETGVHFTFNQQLMSIIFANGSEILLKDLAHYPSDPNFDRLGSLEITGAFVDECNQISEKGWNVLKSRIRYKLDENGIVPKLLGTCNPSKNFVYHRFYKPYTEGTLPGNMKFIQALLGDNPYISKHYKENLLQLDTVTKERLLFGNWEYDDDPSALIPYNKIVDIFSNIHVVEGDPSYITADIARFGDDKTVIMVWMGFVVVEIITLTKQPLSVVAMEIERLKKYYRVPTSNIVADEDGVGSGVVDMLKCFGFVNNSAPDDVKGVKQNFTNLKSQCYFLLAEMINKAEIYVKTDDPNIKNDLIQELEQVKRKDVDKDGKLAVIPKDLVKEKIGRSPDYSDALMMRMFFAIKPRTKFVFAIA